MEVYSINIFSKDSLTPEFDRLVLEDDVILRLGSGSPSTSPSVAIFFSGTQEAINFKNAIIQSWECFLKRDKEGPL